MEHIRNNIPKQPAGGCKAKINYPCVWQYKIIGTDQAVIRAVAAEYLGDTPYSLSTSRTSGNGRYISMALEVTVKNERQRLRLYQTFADHPAVRLVL